MIKLNGPYKTRPIRFLHLAEYNDWRIKVYGIRFQGEDPADIPDPQVVELAREAMLALLPQPAVNETRYGAGFLIIHQGEDRVWLLLDWWYDREILKQQMFSAPLESPGEITRAEDDLLACIWELAIHCFERQAWIETVLDNPDGPDLEKYLEKYLNADL